MMDPSLIQSPEMKLETSVKSDDGVLGIDRVKASVRVFSPELEPDAVSKALGIEPTSSWRKGDPRPSNRGRVARTGMWLLESRSGAEKEPDSQVSDLLNRLNVDLAAWRELRGTVTCDLYLGVFQNDGDAFFEFKPETLRLLGEYGFALCFSIYGPEEIADS